MKTSNIFNSRRIKRIVYIISVFCLGVQISCTNDENEVAGEAYFTIEENPTGISADTQEFTQSYVVRSNRPWKVVAQDAVDWVRAFPAEGEDDGIFKFVIDENITFESRNVNFSFVVDGKEQPVLFRIDQTANIPFIVVEAAESGVAIPSAENSFPIAVKANVNWTYTITDGSWLSEVAISENEITLLAEKNRGETRSAIITVTAAEHPSLDKEIIITQSPGDVILEEKFDWLNYGSPIFYTYSGEVRMDSWTTDEMDKGWNSTENEFSSNQKVVYARTGFLKLGKTGYGGDLISPKLTGLDEPTNLKVTFKAVPYQTKGGTQDDNTLNVSVVGSGTVSINSLTIDNWPDYDADPDCTAIWEDAASSYEFTITGASSDTQIKFLGGDYYLVGVGKGKNRIFLDDIKVTIIE
ncbi:BACON domain-containing protein [Wenyingzhuangia sp. 2_MG-2023]|uniref:BACON domain-containing protein n=1 Tax=Wenyingzhuangia sp. 2_MG-2023 TaxID=3062639 RepID=UPI0026E3AB6B|nr:BACON domain-containing carbohydrate-binding protein [Wenyingzhuangia sp. 2_MG-2023]MDO6738704.1 BACON domain-containing carbohydrate-binding protein [Wenyingzhuangia sp. 2_MG-2023]